MVTWTRCPWLFQTREFRPFGFAMHLGWTIRSTAKVSEEVNRKSPARNTTVQLLALYTDPEPSAKTHNVKDRQADMTHTCRNVFHPLRLWGVKKSCDDFRSWITRHNSALWLLKAKIYKKAVLSQRWPRDAPYIWVPVMSHVSSQSRTRVKLNSYVFPTPPLVSPKFPNVPLEVGGWPLGYKERKCCPCN